MHDLLVTLGCDAIDPATKLVGFVAKDPTSRDA
jgi:hypothetical protein